MGVLAILWRSRGMAIDVKIGMLEEHIGNQSIVWIRILGTERKRKRKMVGVI